MQRQTGGSPAHYSSEHFLIHTDLAADDAERLLQQLETKLERLEEYWGRPCRGVLECFIVHDIDRWNETIIPPVARTIIIDIGGVTAGRSRRVGNRSIHRAVVYCSSRQLVVEHEIVHAYCLQTFGGGGPLWYKEGIAEVFSRLSPNGNAVKCDPEVSDHLRTAPHKPVREIVQSGRFNEDLSNSLTRMLNSDRDSRVRKPTARQRSNEVAAYMDDLKEAYYYSWSLCHLLYSNPNYSQQFRALGKNYVNRSSRSFSDVFGPLEQQIDFEYRFMLQRICSGFRTDLIYWDWDAEFSSIDDDQAIETEVYAAHGFQASQVLLTKGEKYRFQSAGTWKVADAKHAVTADGDADGQGQLVGVIQEGFTLSRPVPLGDDGSFVAPRDGKLFLRCRSDWGRLDQNTGSITVRIEHCP